MGGSRGRRPQQMLPGSCVFVIPRLILCFDLPRLCATAVPVVALHVCVCVRFVVRRRPALRLFFFATHVWLEKATKGPDWHLSDVLAPALPFSLPCVSLSPAPPPTQSYVSDSRCFEQRGEKKKAASSRTILQGCVVPLLLTDWNQDSDRLEDF